MSKRLPRRRSKCGKTKTISYGYVGRWDDETLGWSCPEFAVRYGSEYPTARNWNRGQPHYLCRITIEQVFDSLGRPIVRTLN